MCYCLFIIMLILAFQVLHYPSFSCTYHTSRRSVVHPDLKGDPFPQPPLKIGATLNPDKTTCTLFTPRPCRIYEQSGPNNKQQSTTHGNAPKGSGSYLRSKTHIQHTHPQHLSTSTQTSTNHKSTHCNRMG